MKKKLIMLSLALISCVCVAVGLSACSNAHTHTLTAVEATAATCTTDGNKAYWYCADCGKYYSDANATTEISLSDTVISALGHDYTTTFEWSETDGVYSAKATRVCGNDSTDTETVDAVVTSTTITAVTCTTNGSIKYTATATFSDKSTETEDKTITVTATGHSYDTTTWTSDAYYHWHAATCEHTDEAGDKAPHTLAQDSEGNYYCSACGATITLPDSTETLAEGVNWMILNESNYYCLYSLTFTATESGKYTISVLEGSKGTVYIYDVYEDSHSIGYEASSNSIDLYIKAGLSISFSYVTSYDNCSFPVMITYSEAATSEMDGYSEAKAYEITYVNYNSLAVSLDTDEQFYVKVSSSSDMTAQIYFKNPDSALELYVNGTKVTLTNETSTVTDSEGNESTVTYSYYYFAATSTALTFSLKNTSESTIDTSLICTYWTPTLSLGSNTVTVASETLNSSNSISYSYKPTNGTKYKVTLGTGTDENVAVYVGSTLVLGAGTTETEYIFTGSRNSVYLVIKYTGTTIPSTFNAVITIEEYVEVITYTPLTLDTAAEVAFNASTGVTTAYFSYSTATGGDYTLTLTMGSTWSNVYSAYTTVTINGSTTVSGSDAGVYNLTLNSGENTIVVSLVLTGTLTATLSEKTETIEYYEGTELSLDTEYTLKADTIYTFTASDYGNYTFTIGNSSSDVCIYDVENPDDEYPSIQEEVYGTSNTTKTITLSAGDVLYLSCYSSLYDASIITITYEPAIDTTSAVDLTSTTTIAADTVYSVTLTSTDSATYYTYTYTTTEAADYTFIVSGTVSNVYVLAYDYDYTYYSKVGYDARGNEIYYYETVAIPANVALTIIVSQVFAGTDSFYFEIIKTTSTTSGGAYTAIELDTETTISDTSVYQITATADGKLTFTCISGDFYISLSADSNAYDSDNGTDTELCNEGDTAIAKVTAGTVVYVYLYVNSSGAYTASTFTVTFKEATPAKEGYYNISAIGTESISDDYITYSTTASLTNTTAGTYDGTLDEYTDIDESIRLYTSRSAISMTLTVVTDSRVTIYYAGSTAITITDSNESTQTLEATGSSTTVGVKTITLTAGVTYTFTCSGGLNYPAAIYSFIVVPTTAE